MCERLEQFIIESSNKFSRETEIGTVTAYFQVLNQNINRLPISNSEKIYLKRCVYSSIEIKN